ncbi:hypothetical protein ABGB18_47835 [Nonomuraea sp. B12E4]|uniref:hypothetical protein n=1 Tax=Nonomuraea sp. B12E4 TaxID=3153564 RepID=UPI00325DA635
MLPASGLLEVIEADGIPADDGVTRVLHDPSKPLFVESTLWFEPGDEEGLVPNFTEVRGPILKRALEITQEIRHAREVSEQPSESLSKEHLEALDALGNYPEILHKIHDDDDDVDEYEAWVSANDDAEQGRAARYLEALGDDEVQRRADTSEWADQFSPTPGDPDITTFEECPVCGFETLVAPNRDGYLDEVGIGHCFVCSYERTKQVAEDLASDIVIRRAIERGARPDMWTPAVMRRAALYRWSAARSRSGCGNRGWNASFGCCSG